MRELSIIIPAYNAEKYLPECLNKLSETGLMANPQIQIIIVNDGSNDGTKEICDQLEQKHNNILVIHKKNEGVSVARNTGMKAATGEYVMFLDADDYLDKTNCCYLEEFLQGEEIVEFVAFSYRTLFADGRVQDELLPMEQQRTDDYELTRLYTYASSRFNACWGKLFRRDKIESMGIQFIPGMKIGEDAMFVMQYVKECRSSRIINVPLLYYRQVEESAMHCHTIVQKLADFKILYEYRQKIIGKTDSVFIPMCREHFSVITDLMLQNARSQHGRDLRSAYQQFLQEDMVQQIVEEVRFDTLRPIYKKVEYILMKRKMVRGLTYYFSVKARH